MKLAYTSSGMTKDSENSERRRMFQVVVYFSFVERNSNTLKSHSSTLVTFGFECNIAVTFNPTSAVYCCYYFEEVTSPANYTVFFFSYASCVVALKAVALGLVLDRVDLTLCADFDWNLLASSAPLVCFTPKFTGVDVKRSRCVAVNSSICVSVYSFCTFSSVLIEFIFE